MNKKYYVFSILVLLLFLIAILLFKKEILSKFLPKKEIYISKEISKKEKKIINLLNSALADEWLAYYQYWAGARVATGELSSKVIEELIEHEKDEKKHADMLVPHILDLGGIPILKFNDIQRLTTCGYIVPPTDGDLKLILDQNLEAERCAIRVYKELLKVIKNKYPSLKKDLQYILAEEEEHERDILGLLKNFE